MSAFKLTQTPGKVKSRSRRLATLLVLRTARLAAWFCGVRPYDVLADACDFEVVAEASAWGDHR